MAFLKGMYTTLIGEFEGYLLSNEQFFNRIPGVYLFKFVNRCVLMIKLVGCVIFEHF